VLIVLTNYSRPADVIACTAASRSGRARCLCNVSRIAGQLPRRCCCAPRCVLRRHLTGLTGQRRHGRQTRHLRPDAADAPLCSRDATRCIQNIYNPAKNERVGDSAFRPRV
jgi:hypothetical protein